MNVPFQRRINIPIVFDSDSDDDYSYSYESYSYEPSESDQKTHQAKEIVKLPPKAHFVPKPPQNNFRHCSTVNRRPIVRPKIQNDERPKSVPVENSQNDNKQIIPQFNQQEYTQQK